MIKLEYILDFITKCPPSAVGIPAGQEGDF